MKCGGPPLGEGERRRASAVRAATDAPTTSITQRALEIFRSIWPSVQVLRHVGHAGRLAQLAERLALDLAGALARDPELPANLGQVALDAVLQAVAQLQDAPLLGAELAPDRPHLAPQEASADLFVGRDRIGLFDVGRDLLVLALPALALEPGRLLAAGLERAEGRGRQPERFGRFSLGRRASELLLQLLLGRSQAALGQVDVDRQADALRVLGHGPPDRLHDPPGGVAREAEAFAVVELLDGPNQAAVPLGDQVL